MRILLTGLCLQGNKGGPALALSLISQVQALQPGARFTLSVPGGAEWADEKRWAKQYGVDVCEAVKPGDFFPHGLLHAARRNRLRQWLSAARSAGVVVDLSGIAYVGPPAGTFSAAIRGRFTWFLAAHLANRPFLAWTQSYGPLSSPGIRLLARLDLGALPEIHCRGDDCRAAVQALLPQANVFSFPDVATTLPFDPAWGGAYIQQHFQLSPKGYVSISPSAVIHRKTHCAAGNGHVDEMVGLCRSLTSRGVPVLLVPHTYRPGRHDPDECDFGVCLAIMARLEGMPGVHLVDEDLSPMQLKSIIAVARCHVGGRYHSMVAALSAGVPAVSLSWHPKYRDLMREYGVASFVHDATVAGTAPALIALVDNLLLAEPGLRAGLAAAQQQVAARVAENARRFVAMLPEAT